MFLRGNEDFFMSNENRDMLHNQIKTKAEEKLKIKIVLDIKNIKKLMITFLNKHDSLIKDIKISELNSKVVTNAINIIIDNFNIRKRRQTKTRYISAPDIIRDQDITNIDIKRDPDQFSRPKRFLRNGPPNREFKGNILPK